MIKKLIQFYQDRKAKKLATRIKKEKLARIKEARKFLMDNEEIPVSWQMDTVCKILRIEPNESAKRFIYRLCWPNVDLNVEADKLPDSNRQNQG